ncbi:MAG: hypothetical protein IPM45_03210 [Acidimicrobiales bacterium]|nr:hypothetical protein [Acidimicrobiales bacterium]
MALTDAERLRLHRCLEDKLGPDEAALLMTAVPPVDWSDIVTKDVLRGELALVRGEMSGLRSELRGEMAGVRGEMVELRSELRGEMAGVRGEMVELRGGMAELRGDVVGLRGELKAEIRGELSAFKGQLMLALVALVVSMIGVMLVGVRLAV